MDLPANNEELSEPEPEPRDGRRKPLSEETLHRLRTMNIGKKRPPEHSERLRTRPIRKGTTNLENVLKLKGSNAHYTEDEKASALICLAKNKWCLTDTAKETGISMPTLEAWKKGRGITDAVRIKAGMKARKLKDKINDGLHEAFDILRASLEEMSPKEVLEVYKSWFEQNQLLAHEPTSISGSKGVESEEELFERLVRIAAKYQIKSPNNEQGGSRRVSEISKPTPAETDLGALPQLPSGTSLQLPSK